MGKTSLRLKRMLIPPLVESSKTHVCSQKEYVLQAEFIIQMEFICVLQNADSTELYSNGKHLTTILHTVRSFL